MNPRLKYLLTGILAFGAGALLVYFLMPAAVKPAAATATDSGADGPARVMRGPDGEPMILLATNVAEAMGIQTQPLAAAVWAPETACQGWVLNPAPLGAAVLNLASARATAAASAKEYERLKGLARQGDAADRVLETAQAVADRDALALEALRTQFQLDWGAALAARDDLPALVRRLAGGACAVVRLDLPADRLLTAPPVSARLTGLAAGAPAVAGVFLDAAPAVDPQSQAAGFLFLVNSPAFKPNAAVTGFLQFPGRPVHGVVVPPEAVVHAAGGAWVYLQQGDGAFARLAITTGHRVAGGWLVAGRLAPGAQVVVAGAQQLLSTELVSQLPPPD